MMNFEYRGMKYFFFFLSFLLVSCHEECDQYMVADLKFSESDLRINPYDGTENLLFRSDDGSTVLFGAGNRKTEHDRGYEIDSETAKIYHDDCQGDYFDFEYNWLILKDSVTDTFLKIDLRFLFSGFKNPHTEKEFDLDFFTHHPVLMCFYGSYNFRNDTLFTKPQNTGTDRDSVVALYQSLTLGTHSYNKVFELYCKNPDHRDTAWMSTAYYTVAEGLVGFKTSYGKLWTKTE